MFYITQQCAMSLTELHRKTKADDLNLQCMFHHYEIHNKFFN